MLIDYRSVEPYEMIIRDEIVLIKSIQKKILLDPTDIKSLKVYPGIIYVSGRGGGYKPVCFMMLDTKEGFFQFHLKYRKLGAFNIRSLFHN